MMSNSVLVVTGETGSGKSTQIPQYLLSKGHKKIAITQPRRVGAISLSTRVASEMNVELGREVGYSVRFDDCSSHNTRIKYLTDGCLLRECLQDRSLKRYDAIILDEAHERSLQTDILIGLLKEMLQRRRDGFRLIITSATLNTAKFCAFFSCKSFHIPGRCFPVNLKHLEEAPRRYVLAAVETTLRIHCSRPPEGHILVFLTGREEVEDSCELLGRKIDALIDKGVDLPDIAILPAYSTLRASEQRKIFYSAPENCRKVVFATNIAETSLTVPGVRFVVDSGFVKQKNFNQQTGIDALVIVRISKTCAVQRAGRAGRTCPGECYRLYSEEDYSSMQSAPEPEIVRSSLPGVILVLKSLKVADPLNFPFLDSPPVDAIADGLKRLFILGAVTTDGELTQLGRSMARFPLEPTVSKLLVASSVYRCKEMMLSIACMMSVDEIWVHCTGQEEMRSRALVWERFSDSAGDHVALVNAFEAWRKQGYSRNWAETNFLDFWALKTAKAVRDQLESIIGRAEGQIKLNESFGIEEKDGEKLRCQKILAGVFFANSCRLVDGAKGVVYRPLDGCRGDKKGPEELWMRKNCSLYQKPPRWIVFERVMFTSKPYLHHVTAVRFEWVADLIPKIDKVDTERLCGRKLGRNDKSNGTVKVAQRVRKTSCSKGTIDKAEIAKKRYLERKKKRIK